MLSVPGVSPKLHYPQTPLFHKTDVYLYFYVWILKVRSWSDGNFRLFNCEYVMFSLFGWLDERHNGDLMNLKLPNSSNLKHIFAQILDLPMFEAFWWRYRHNWKKSCPKFLSMTAF